ncbi:hypothetical protein, partial [Halomonas elongata]|uniref:hypothetical protein n=1 Tax=Halomonas elongata TaxID=2746 RepID=UPI001CB9D1A9
REVSQYIQRVNDYNPVVWPAAREGAEAGSEKNCERDELFSSALSYQAQTTSSSRWQSLAMLFWLA